MQAQLYVGNAQLLLWCIQAEHGFLWEDWRVKWLLKVIGLKEKKKKERDTPPPPRPKFPSVTFSVLKVETEDLSFMPRVCHE